MSTASFTRTATKPHANGRPIRRLADDQSAAFFMPAGSMTLEEFRQWTYADDFPKNAAIAYIAGEIFIDMSPERIDSHASPKVEIYVTLGSLVRKKRKGRIFFDRTRVVHADAEVSNEPEAFFATWATLKKGTLRKVRNPDGDDFIEFEGTPDWIMEIVSPSSVTKDKKQLKKSYHRAGIGEYWLIDARKKDVDFQILVHGEKSYEPAETDGEWQVSRVFGKKFRLRRITDELGDVDYRLDVK